MRATRAQWSAGAAGPVIAAIPDLEDHDPFRLDPLAWQDLALCAQTDPEAFFPDKGGSTREAKRVCFACDVRAECLEYALANGERFGIWGGLSERERRRHERENPQPLQLPTRWPRCDHLREPGESQCGRCDRARRHERYEQRKAVA